MFYFFFCLVCFYQDSGDECAIQYAVDAVIAVEKNITTTTVVGLYGAYQVGGRPMADWWMRQYLAIHLSCPE